METLRGCPPAKRHPPKRAPPYQRAPSRRRAAKNSGASAHTARQHGGSGVSRRRNIKNTTVFRLAQARGHFMETLRGCPPA